MPARKAAPVTISNDEHEIKIYTTESHGRPLNQLSYYRGGKRERRMVGTRGRSKPHAGRNRAMETARALPGRTADGQIPPKGAKLHEALSSSP